MLTLHLAAEGGYYGVLRPWVEADADERERARSERKKPLKPTVDAPECLFSGGPELLHAALPPGFKGGPDQWAVVWLPSDDQGPIPSSERIGARSGRKALRLAPWAISTLSLEPRELSTLIAGYARLKPVWPEGWLGEDFAFWRAVWEVAGAMVVRQQYLPGLRRMGEDSSHWSPTWEPMYDAEDLRRHEELAAAMPLVAQAVRWKADEMPPNQPKLLVSDMVSRLVECLVWMAHLTHDVSRRHAPRRSRWTWRLRSVDERWVETLLTPDLKLKGNPGDLMALEVEVDNWHDIGFTMPRNEIAEQYPAPAITLPQKDADFWAGHKLPRGFSGPLEAPGIPGMVFERVGQVPRWRGERPLRESLLPVYEAASRYALEHVFGRKP
jgi:hypothetical protein